MRSDAPLLDLTPAQFQARLPALLRIYAAAMNAPRMQLPSRGSVMDRHATHSGFRAVIATRPAMMGTGPVLGFAYGFRGEAGQWWHDRVHTALAGCADPDAADRWLADSFEVAEVHVRPGSQGRGIGRAMVTRLTAGLTTATAVLSTGDTESPARQLYRSLGFTDLLTGFTFAGTAVPYAIMGAAVPIRAHSAAPLAAQGNPP